MTKEQATEFALSLFNGDKKLKSVQDLCDEAIAYFKDVSTPTAVEAIEFFKKIKCVDRVYNGNLCDTYVN